LVRRAVRGAAGLLVLVSARRRSSASAWAAGFGAASDASGLRAVDYFLALCLVLGFRDHAYVAKMSQMIELLAARTGELAASR
jgi:hypothetical protein